MGDALARRALAQEGCEAVRSALGWGLVARTLTVVRFGASTVPALLAATARRVPERVFLRFLDPARRGAAPKEVTFSAFRAMVCRAAAYLEAAGLRPGDRVLLLAENSPEWQAVAIATQLLQAEPAALFASLASAPAVEIARRVGPRVAFVSTKEQWAKLAPVGAELVRQGLSALLTADALSPDSLPAGLRATTVASVVAERNPTLSVEDFEARAAAVAAESPFLLLFTSGTTGRQKGVRLAQESIVRAVEAGGPATGRTERDVGLHLLPFGHIAGHDQFVLALAQGHALLLVTSREELLTALALGPTYVFSVPLVYERIRTGALEKVDKLPGPLRRFVHHALEAAVRVRVEGKPKPGDALLTAAVDVLLGRKVRAALGGRVEGLFAGGAPSSEALFRFFEGLGIPLVELYGMSETAGMISSNLFDGRRRPGVAGLLTPDHEVLIAKDGELLLRGPLLLKGYLEPEDGAGAFTEDGFFRTGDLVELDKEGWLRIVGRKKHLMVLSTGKKIAPEPVETAIASESPFEGAVLLGDGEAYVTAAVFVRRDALAQLAAEGKDAATTLLGVALSTLSAFSDYEKPKRLLIVPGGPTDYPELITPTLKLRRPAVLRLLESEIAALYAAPKPATA